MITESTRPGWDEVWMSVAHVVSARATCPRMPVGAVVVSQANRVLSIGYNGAPRGLPHCEDDGCIMLDDHCVRAVHAELNAILNMPGPCPGATLYITHFPCPNCTGAIAQAGISRVVHLLPYGTLDTQNMTREAFAKLGIRLEAI